MAAVDNKYLNLTGLAEVASKVNEKLKKVSTMPASPTNGDIVLYIGTTTGSYIHGCLYQYDSTESAWILQDTSVILNGVDKTGAEASFYAPTGSGTSGQVLVSGGTNTAPTWSSFSGYAPQIIDDSLCFYYGTVPEVQNTAIIFEV